MLKNSSPTQTEAWKKLEKHYQEVQPQHLRDLFAQDPQRFQKFTYKLNDTLYDLSKNRITEETLRLLTQLAEQMDVPAAKIGRAHV